MKQKLKSLQLRMLLPVIAMTLFVVILLTMLFSRAYINMILQQEQEVNSAGFDTVSHTITPLIDTAISDTRTIMADDRVAFYARHSYASAAELIHARISCRDYLAAEIERNDDIYGLLFMRTDGSLFGMLPQGSFFHDLPETNPLPEEIRTQILNVPLGQTIWAGPISASGIYGFENSSMPEKVMIAAWKSVDVRYEQCYALMLMDGSVFERLFSVLDDGKSIWHVFTEDGAEIYHMGQGACLNPERLLSESNTGEVIHDEDGHPGYKRHCCGAAWRQCSG